MASPQWKNFQPPAQDTAMLAYQRSPSINKSPTNSNNNFSNNSSNNADSSSGLREAGIVEKLLHSYGFIQCCERQARLFFHYSQYTGNIEHLKLGDPVEFEMTYDRRTGKPIASAVVKISPEALSGEVLSEDRVSGFITTEIKEGSEGRVAYENRGECFFLPYTKDDVEEPEIDLRPGDKVTFNIASDKHTGNPRARNIRLEKPQPQRHQGVICSLKETFGFIERADVVKEIFFHSSECKEDFKGLRLGDDVEFSIQTRNNKEVAVKITPLSPGTVVFEDISSEAIIGEVVKTLDKGQSRQSGDPLSGKIRYCRDGRDIEVPFGERDPKGEFTFYIGDWVQFNIAIDRRDQLQRATAISLLNESFLVSGEKREQGVVVSVKDSYGFIQCVDRDARLYFKTAEVLEPDDQIKSHDEVEFTVVQDSSSSNRHQAVRIHRLPQGTVNLDYNSSISSDLTKDTDDQHRLIGIVDKEATSQWNSKHSANLDKFSNEDDNRNQNGAIHDTEEGTIIYHTKSGKESITYQLKDCDFRNQPRVGDKVEFTIATLKSNGHQVASDIKICNRTPRNGFRYTHRGFIAALKDSFGFIETENHDREVFFHFSVYDGNASNLEIGQEVEYGLSHKGSKLSAECVRKISNGTIVGEDIQAEILNGTVTRPVRCFNPEQDDYPGLIQVSGEDGSEGIEYPFGITSLVDKHEYLQKGDVVQFQIGISKKGEERATNIKVIRTHHQATVETIKGNFGFLSYEVEEGKKLFFHMSEVKDGASLQPGDRVEFVVVHQQRTGKYSAYSVVKIGESQPSQRPERLISRLRTTSLDDNGPRVILVRQPKGPDGSNGFKVPRRLIAKAAAILECLEEANGSSYLSVEMPYNCSSGGSGDGKMTAVTCTE